MRPASACKLLAALGLAAVLGQARPAGAWEAQTTHAGLTEQAALGSSLHRVLVERFGAEDGLFELLTIPPADAEELYVVLHRLLNPTHGYVPNGRGRLHALGWLVAGAVIADTPVEHAAHHFFDPVNGRGLTSRSLGGLGSKLRRRLAGHSVDEDLVGSGVSAPEWITHRNNPMNLEGFLGQYARAIRAPHPAARARHLAGAMLAAGAMLHVLQDTGSPSHVRDDLAAHYDKLGPDTDDVGSRFEQVASLAYGRLGVPRAGEPVKRPTLRAYFTADDGRGLADLTATSWFSAHTLPRSFRVKPNTNRERLREQFERSLRRAQPGPRTQFVARAGRIEGGAGVCLAEMEKTTEGRYRFFIGDRCALEQLRMILPQVSSYGAGMLETLFRGGLEIEPGSDQLVIKSAGADFGAGKVSVFWDDDRGVRTEYVSARPVQGSVAGIRIAEVAAPPEGARRVAVLFEGVDQAGQPLVAAGQMSWPPAAAGGEATAPAAVEERVETEVETGSETETESDAEGETETETETEGGSTKPGAGSGDRGPKAEEEAGAATDGE